MKFKVTLQRAVACARSIAKVAPFPTALQFQCTGRWLLSAGFNKLKYLTLSHCFGHCDDVWARLRRRVQPEFTGVVRALRLEGRPFHRLRRDENTISKYIGYRPATLDYRPIPNPNTPTYILSTQEPVDKDWWKKLEPGTRRSQYPPNRTSPLPLPNSQHVFSFVILILLFHILIPPL